MKNNNSSVHVKLNVNGAVQWRYDYLDRNTNYTGTYSDGMPHEHALGLPTELAMQVDAWTFWLINPTSDIITAQATIEWSQGGLPIANWNSGTITINANSATTTGDGATLIL